MQRLETLCGLTHVHTHIFYNGSIVVIRNHRNKTFESVGKVELAFGKEEGTLSLSKATPSGGSHHMAQARCGMCSDCTLQWADIECNSIKGGRQ